MLKKFFLKEKINDELVLQVIKLESILLMNEVLKEADKKEIKIDELAESFERIFSKYSSLETVTDEKFYKEIYGLLVLLNNYTIKNIDRRNVIKIKEDLLITIAKVIAKKIKEDIFYGYSDIKILETLLKTRTLQKTIF